MFCMSRLESSSEHFKKTWELSTFSIVTESKTQDIFLDITKFWTNTKRVSLRIFSYFWSWNIENEYNLYTALRKLELVIWWRNKNRIKFEEYINKVSIDTSNWVLFVIYDSKKETMTISIRQLKQKWWISCDIEISVTLCLEDNNETLDDLTIRVKEEIFHALSWVQNSIIKDNIKTSL